MRSAVLQKGSDNPFAEALLDEIEKIQGRQGRIYTTEVSSADDLRRFVFTTTSKDIHLQMGIMTPEMKVLFADFIEFEMQKSDDGRVLIAIVRSEEEGPAILAIQSQPRQYFLSYAR